MATEMYSKSIVVLTCVTFLLQISSVAAQAISSDESDVQEQQPVVVWEPVEDLRNAADAGDPIAITKLADYYFWGPGEDLKKAVSWYKKAANKGNPLGRVMAIYSENPDTDIETLELKLDEAILRETAPLESGLSFIKVLYVVAPLLGLLGTVVGMIATFQMITLFGTGDPRMMAGGISTALVTTVLGLVVAIPLTLLHSFLQGKSKSLIQVLEEQAAGIIARLAESR